MWKVDLSNLQFTLDFLCRKDLDKILALLPDKMSRQTLLFSATFPSDIQQLAKFALKPDFKIVDTVGEETNTSTQVHMPSTLYCNVSALHVKTTMNYARGWCRGVCCSTTLYMLFFNFNGAVARSVLHLFAAMTK